MHALLVAALLACIRQGRAGRVTMPPDARISKVGTAIVRTPISFD
jgi:hypothetical protein